MKPLYWVTLVSRRQELGFHSGYCDAPSRSPPQDQLTRSSSCRECDCQRPRAVSLWGLCSAKGSCLAQSYTPPWTTCIQCLVRERTPFLKGAPDSRALFGLAETFVATILKFISSLLPNLLIHSFIDSVPESTPNESPAWISLAQNMFSGSPDLHICLLILATQAPAHSS